MKYSDVFGIKSSRILLGTTYFGSSTSEADAFSLMDRYCELGGTHIDTARMYSGGEAEKVIGKWMKSRGKNGILVSTKGGFSSKDTPEIARLSKSEIFFDVDLSLLALSLDCIDFYWLHRDDVQIPVDEIIGYMNELVKMGKIRAFGASNWSFERIREANAYASAHGLSGFDASQVRFSPASINELEKGLVSIDRDSFEYYSSINMPVVAFSSQAKGFFSKMHSGGKSSLSPKAAKRYFNEKNCQTLTIIEKIAKNHGCSVAAVIGAAFSALEKPEVFAIIGASNVSQLEDSMSAGDVSLDKSEALAVFKNVIG